MLFARKTQHGYYIVNEHGVQVDRSGEITYHPVPCKAGEYPEAPEHSVHSGPPSALPVVRVSKRGKVSVKWSKANTAGR